MIDYIKGKIAQKEQNRLVVECGGLGYDLSVSNNCLSLCGETGQDIKIFTELKIKDDCPVMFGFFSKAEKNMFLRLITVSGVGPKAAISILGAFSPENLIVSIVSGDSKKFSAIKGIGKKTAERIVLELSDKFSAEFNLIQSSPIGENNIASFAPNEAVEALMTLGFSKQEAQSRLSKVRGRENLSMEQLIFSALKEE